MAIKQKNKLRETPFLLGHIRLTEKQQNFLNVILNPKNRVIFLVGNAGTSKTFLSIYAGLHLYLDQKIKKIQYLRTVVESGEKSLGFLPGQKELKESLYFDPLYQTLEVLLQKEEMLRLENEEVIVPSSINFIRGCNFNSDVYSVTDESQNFSQKELLTVMTRLNKGSKLVCCGDFLQSDLKTKSGLRPVVELFDNEESRNMGIQICRFTKEDCQRDPVTQFIVEKFESLHSFS